MSKKVRPSVKFIFLKSFLQSPKLSILLCKLLPQSCGFLSSSLRSLLFYLQLGKLPFQPLDFFIFIPVVVIVTHCALMWWSRYTLMATIEQISKILIIYMKIERGRNVPCEWDKFRILSLKYERFYHNKFCVLFIVYIFPHVYKKPVIFKENSPFFLKNKVVIPFNFSLFW